MNKANLEQACGKTPTSIVWVRANLANAAHSHFIPMQMHLSYKNTN